MTTTKSFMRRFIFDKLPLRGVYVVLSDVWTTIVEQKEYPDSIKQILGELLSANVLMTSNLKLKGKITVQIQDNPKLDLVVSECSNDLIVRATAKFSKSIHEDNQISYLDCLAKGALVISIDSKGDGKLYQSVIALPGLDLSEVLNEYMLQSEQLKSIFILACSEDKVVGFMLQQLPDHAGNYIDDINRIFMLANTLTKGELMHEDIVLILHKLFNEDDIVLYEPHPVKFSCTCSRAKVSNMLRSIGKEEAHSIILEQGKIEVTCDFCNTNYIFDINDVNNIFSMLCVDMESISQEIH